jgi:hypothetical protein
MRKPDPVVQSEDGPLPASILSAVARYCPQLTHLYIHSTTLHLDQLYPLVTG